MTVLAADDDQRQAESRVAVKPGKTAPQSLWRVFGAPLMLGILSAIGLTGALLGDDFWDAVSWLTLGIPIVVIGFFVWRKG